MDWQAGVWRSPEAGTRSPDLSVAITGDWAPIRALEPLALENPEGLYGDVLHELRQSDLRIANVECPLCPEGEAFAPIPKEGPGLRGEPAAVNALTAAGFDVACLANNHIFDYGTAGFTHTRDLLRERGILTVGAGESDDEAYAPLLTTVKGTTLGIVNLSEGEDCTASKGGPGVAGWDIGRLERLVREAAEAADIVLVIAHCGREYVPVPPPYIYEAYHRLAAAGADMIVGHHPHVPQGIGFAGDVPVAYSLGNFVFYQSADLRFRRTGYMLSVDIADKQIAGFRAVPYRIGASGLSKLSGDERGRFFESLRSVSEPLRTLREVRDVWNAYIDHFGIDRWEEDCAGLFEIVRNFGDLGPQGRAALRNRMVTPAHRELVTDAMTRMLNGEMGASPDWARKLVARWLTEPLSGN